MTQDKKINAIVEKVLDKGYPNYNSIRIILEKAITLAFADTEKRYRLINPNCEKCGNELHTYFSEDFKGSKEGTCGWFCPTCDKEKQETSKREEFIRRLEEETLTEIFTKWEIDEDVIEWVFKQIDTIANEIFKENQK